MDYRSSDISLLHPFIIHFTATGLEILYTGYTYDVGQKYFYVSLVCGTSSSPILDISTQLEPDLDIRGTLTAKECCLVPSGGGGGGEPTIDGLSIGSIMLIIIRMCF